MSSYVMTSWRIRKYGRHTITGWASINEETGSICLLLQPDMGYLLIIQNGTILESVPLLQDPETVQVHINGDMLMFVITNKTTEPPRRFRVLFECKENPRKPSSDCADALRKFFTIHETVNNSDSIRATTLAETFERIVNIDATTVQHISTKPLAGPVLDNLVRLCLLDPTFPSLVASVQKSVKSLNIPIVQKSLEE